MKLTVRETVIFAFLGTLMFISKLVLEGLPNVHLLAVLTAAYTVVYRAKALYPIYVCVFLVGLYGGFNTWWVPYLYLWTILWGAVMLLPKEMSPKALAVVLPMICAAHGFLYGTLYAPFQALAFGLDFKGMIAWIVSGLPWDAIHGAGNLVLGFLAVPIIALLRRLERRSRV